MEYLGLSESEVLALKKKFGENVIFEKEKISLIKILLPQLKSPLVLILAIVAGISLFFGEFFDFVLIISVLILNTLMGFFQEYNAKRTLYALRKILKPMAMVIREGKRKLIEAKDLVPGDLVVLVSGDKIPADGKLIQGEILVSEAILTGEEEGITKKEGDKVFMGTTVLSGKGIMEVEKIGKETEFGKIGKALVEIEEGKTPLQKKLEDLSKNLAILVLAICFLIFISRILGGGEIYHAFKTSIVLAVAAIPEALPVIITVILALGMKRILKKQGLVKTLLATEVLGSTSVICLDKTGTLTEGKMKVTKFEFENKEEALKVMLLNNEERMSLEVALFNFAKENLKETAEKLLKEGREIFEEPFDSAKKYSMSIWEIEGKKVSLLAGAPEIVFDFCKIDEEKKKKYLKILDEWAQDGLRVLAFAKKENGNLKEKKDFEFLGVVGISDPVRKEAKEMIEIAKKAGISVKIVTGDYRKTAERVAKSLGLEVGEENVMESEESEKISKEELKEKIDKIVLFTRVLPHQKRKIVDVLKEKGEVVAMTGDGVNDALALKEADIGIAVGEATEVAKEAADLILLDSNFKTIISTCEEGRLILSNIKKSVGYILSNSFLEIAVLFLAGILKFPPPLTIPQILYLHLICDGPPDLIFAFEPKERDLMERKPIDIRKEPILDKLLVTLIFSITVFVSLISILLFFNFGIKSENLKLASTLVFATLGAIDLIYVISFKNLRKPIIKTQNFFKNKFLPLAILYGFLLLFFAIYFPPLQKILNTVHLQIFHWLIVFGIGILTTILLEILKVIFSKNHTNPKFKI
jgi:Ca2+-transporting ATPase